MHVNPEAWKSAGYMPMRSPTPASFVLVARASSGAKPWHCLGRLAGVSLFGIGTVRAAWHARSYLQASTVAQPDAASFALGIGACSKGVELVTGSRTVPAPEVRDDQSLRHLRQGETGKLPLNFCTGPYKHASKSTRCGIHA